MKISEDFKRGESLLIIAMGAVVILMVGFLIIVLLDHTSLKSIAPYVLAISIVGLPIGVIGLKMAQMKKEMLTI